MWSEQIASGGVCYAALMFLRHGEGEAYSQGYVGLDAEIEFENGRVNRNWSAE